MDKVIIWGLSNYSKEKMKRRMIPVDMIEGVIDIDKNRHGEMFLGREIVGPECLEQFSSKIIVVASHRFYDEIASQINGKYLVLGIDKFVEEFPCLEINSTAIQLWEEQKSKLVTPIEECNKVWNEFKNVMIVRKIADKGLGKKVRVGKKNDGGYIMLEDAVKGAKIAYSLGIADEVSWDLQMAEQYGCDVFQYDHTIERAPVEHEKLHYKKVGICGAKCNSPKLMTLEQMLEENHHNNETRMILKMDVEGAEWDVIETIDQETLNKFDQIVMEIHGFADITQIEARIKYLKKLNETHQLIHIHANNYCPLARRYVGKAMLIYAYEVTYVKKDKYKFYDDIISFPQEIDQPCDPTALDIELGNWGKKNG